MNRLIAHDWPGNVRELENTLERAVLFTQGPELDDVQFTSNASADLPKGHVGGNHRQVLESTEKDYLAHALRRCRGNVGQLAAELNITRRAVYLKLKKHGLEPKDYR